MSEVLFAFLIIGINLCSIMGIESRMRLVAYSPGQILRDLFLLDKHGKHLVSELERRLLCIDPGQGEENAQDIYGHFGLEAEEINEIIREEKEHEKAVLEMLDEEFLQYTSSMVLGLNDALVELTGALAGFTLALKNSRLIALVGLVTGIAASLSMASSEYLSTYRNGRPEPRSRGTQFFYRAFAPFISGCGYLIALLLMLKRIDGIKVRRLLRRMMQCPLIFEKILDLLMKK